MYIRSHRGEPAIRRLEQAVALASGLVFHHQNGVEVEDPAGLLYDLMMGAATKSIGKPEIGATLRSLVVPPSD